VLYLGRDPQPSWSYPPLTDQGYANRELYAYWSARDPLVMYAARLESERVIEPGESERIRRDAEAIVEEQAQAVIAAPWPSADEAGTGVLACEAPRARIGVLDPAGRHTSAGAPPLPPLGPQSPRAAQGCTLFVAPSLCRAATP